MGRIRRAAAIIGLTLAGFGGAVTVPAAAIAQAAEPTILENPIGSGGICPIQPFGGRVGQSFTTPAAASSLTEYTVYTTGEAPQGVTTLLKQWTDDGPTLVHSEAVTLPAGTQAVATFTPTTPVTLAAASTYSIEFQYGTEDGCNVGLALGPSYAGGLLMVDGTGLRGDALAFRLVLSALGSDPQLPPAIDGTAPPATVGLDYAYQYELEGDPAPTVAIIEGGLPRGVTLSDSGLLSGVPIEAGTFSFTMQAVNGVLPTAEHATQLVVHPASVGAPPGAAPPAAAPPPTVPARGAGAATRARALPATGSEAGAVAVAAVTLLAAGAAVLATAAGRRAARCTTQEH